MKALETKIPQAWHVKMHHSPWCFHWPAVTSGTRPASRAACSSWRWGWAPLSSLSSRAAHIGNALPNISELKVKQAFLQELISGENFLPTHLQLAGLLGCWAKRMQKHTLEILASRIKLERLSVLFSAPASQHISGWECCESATLQIKVCIQSREHRG